MTDIAELKAQHGVIRAAVRHLLDVAVTARGYRAAASGLLHDLSASIAVHAATEGDFPWRSEAADTAARERFTRDWVAYRATWSTGRIATDWAGFVAATHALMPRMLARLDREEVELDRLAAARR